MAGVDKTILESLDGIALKIILIEPGDLSVVGEILEYLEKILNCASLDNSASLRTMAEFVKQVLEKIIMAELMDSADNYERIGECVSLMQDVARQGGEAKESQLKMFCDRIAETGFDIGCAQFPDTSFNPHGLPADETTRSSDSEAPPESSSEVDSQTAPGPEAGPMPPAEKVAPGTAMAAPAPLEATEIAVTTAMDDEPMVVQDPQEFMKDLELLSGFIEESYEHLEAIEANILELENNPADPEIINNIFRPFHTIKGVSGFLNLKAINKLAHTTENLLDDVRNNVRTMDSQVIDIVLGVGDYLRSMIDNIKEVLEGGQEKYKPFDIRPFTGRIRAIQSGTAVGPENASPAETGEVLSAPAEETVPEASALREERDAPEPRIAPPVEHEQKKAAAPPAAAPNKAGGGRIDASIKVNVEKLDALVNAVGELVIMQSLVQQNPLVQGIVDPKLSRDFSQLGRITSELQKTAMSMRMVPIRQTFQKMIRLVRDLSKKSGKDVELIMEGEETEIDRNMVDSIYDPLVHMIRNSVDHGVQLPAEREKAGKPPTGGVYLRAYQKGGNMVIEIEDDGNGLNTEKIRKKAIKRGLIAPEANLSAHELNNLIFLPGFSTADKITDVSGRGVGMDVVKKAVEKLRGKVEVVSEAGRGSKFIIKLPLTLAIIDGIIVRVGGERYIIPTIAIRESLKPQSSQYKTVYDKGEAILLRDSLVPIIRLYKVFDVEPSNTDPCATILVVVEYEGLQRALMVDEVLGKQEVVIKSLGGLLTDIKGVAGGTILGDGRVGLILDLAGLIAASKEKGRNSTMEDETGSEPF